MRALAVVLCLAGAASADEPEPTAETASPAPVARGRLAGLVFERGSISPLAGARVITADATATTDDAGRFTLDLAAGMHDVLVTAEGHEPLRATERIDAGRALTVEYTLLPSRSGRRYESTVRGEARHEGDRVTLEKEELHQLPSALEDPFRIVGALPGVATPLPLLPYYVIRGASPGMNGFFLDGMRVPQLFHFLVGGGVVHGRLIDRLEFYPGAYDVSFGRYAGGVVDSETRPARARGYHGEVELRLYDVSVLGEGALPGGVRLEIAGHYGYPTFIIHAVDDRFAVQYGDYTLRLDWRGFTLEALGSFDQLEIATERFTGALALLPDLIQLQFHRVQLRDRERVGRAELEAAIVGGYDDNIAVDGIGVRKWSLGWRFIASVKWPRFRLQVGTDGELSRFEPINFVPLAPAQPDEYGDFAAPRDGVVAGAYALGTVELLQRRLTLTAGLRIDTYHANNVTLLGLDPRGSIRARLLPWLSIEAGFGLYQQPPSFPIPIPGIDTFALQLGLQRAYQAATAVEAKLPHDFSVKLSGFYERFYNINDVTIDFAPQTCTSPPPESLTGFPATVTRQIDGQSYGMELMVRRHAGRVTGWIAYTLSRAERQYSCGLAAADFDQAHLLNVVVQARLPWQLMLGAHLYFASGRPVTILDPTNLSAPTRNNTRLPDFVQLDLRLDREWIFRRWALSAFLEVVNVTYSTSYFGVQYPKIDGMRRYDMPQLNGFPWILPTVGVRGRF
jgi:TonB dependent receptor-like, beta-barrel